MNKKFDFNNINLIPKYFHGESRNDLDVTIQLGKFKFKNPIIPANMESVINENLAITLAKNGYFYIMHRFDLDVISFINNMKTLNLVSSISLGVKEQDLELVRKLKELNLEPDFITIDIAHGHSKLMKEALINYKKLLPNTFFIAGNISTEQACFDLKEWGADAIKIGIGPGSACTTYNCTGFGTRNMQANAIYDIAKKAHKLGLKIIGDGGIKEPGDITKALVLGADMCMVGNLLAGCTDSPGKIIEILNKKYVEYYGSASIHNSGKLNRIEGTKILIEYKEKTLIEQMNYLNECLQSSISYGGGNKLIDLKYVSFQLNNK